jgi:hypothetical protein
MNALRFFSSLSAGTAGAGVIDPSLRTNPARRGYSVHTSLLDFPRRVMRRGVFQGRSDGGCEGVTLPARATARRCHLLSAASVHEEVGGVSGACSASQCGENRRAASQRGDETPPQLLSANVSRRLYRRLPACRGLVSPFAAVTHSPSAAPEWCSEGGRPTATGTYGTPSMRPALDLSAALHPRASAFRRLPARAVPHLAGAACPRAFVGA